MSLLIKTQQHWLPRTVDSLLTLLAWAGVTYLVIMGVLGMLESNQQGARASLGHEFLLTLDTLLIYLMVAVVITAMLFTWAKYNQLRAEWYPRRKRMSDVGEMGLAESFQVSVAVLECLQKQQVLIVHNHAHGALKAIELPGIAVRMPAHSNDEKLEELMGIDGQTENMLAL
jgi:biofilm PGA synthesis protein PgaD